MKTYLQTICVIVCASGIVIEIIYGSDLGYILLCAGSLAFAVSTKIENRVHK